MISNAFMLLFFSSTFLCFHMRKKNWKSQKISKRKIFTKFRNCWRSMDSFTKIAQLDLTEIEPKNNKTFGTKSLWIKCWNRKSKPDKTEHLKGVGRGRGTMAVRGQVAGLHGNNRKADLHQRVGAQVATGGQGHRGQTHRLNARGIRAKPLTNITAGEKQTNQIHLVERKSSLLSQLT